MKWLGYALFGMVVGNMIFGVVWAMIHNHAKTPEAKRAPAWPVWVAMNCAFIFVALQMRGFVGEVLPRF
ncbi:MAG: hypothetical protein GY948_00540 [Alphaproteobacteria bacterium]|nr:hypothetical protein [Alphaproteobacteria bacterium]